MPILTFLCTEILLKSVNECSVCVQKTFLHLVCSRYFIWQRLRLLRRATSMSGRLTALHYGSERADSTGN